MSVDEEDLPARYKAPFPTFGKHGMVVSDHPLASQAGLEVLKNGGNAVDAAVAVSLALGVVCPYYTGIGGGGFMLVWTPGMDAPRCLDYRETAPAASDSELYTRAEEGRSVLGALAVGVPGTIRGLALACQELGKIGWSRAVEPAIAVAEREVEVDPNYVRVTVCKREEIATRPRAAAMFLGPEGEVPFPGTPRRHPDLAWTYRRLAEHGAEDFYQGEVAARLLRAVEEDGGIVTARDLLDYRPVWRQPLLRNFRDHAVCTVGPPSGGGIQLLQILRIMENFPIEPGGWGSAAGLHLLTEAMRISFHERASRITDPDFAHVPTEWLLERARLDALSRRILPDRVLPLEGQPTPAMMGGGTAAFVVASADGTVVSATESVNLWHGSMVVPEGTGFVLNNVMDDFACYPGRADAFGLFSSSINEVVPGKRPASSSTPALVLKDGRPLLAVGSAGGPRITTAVAQIILNNLDHGLNIQQAVTTPRIHHQHRPDKLFVEPQTPLEVRRGLEKIGHHVQEATCRSHAVALKWDEEVELFTGGHDFRSFSASAGY